MRDTLGLVKLLAPRGYRCWGYGQLLPVRAHFQRCFLVDLQQFQNGFVDDQRQAVAVLG